MIDSDKMGTPNFLFDVAKGKVMNHSAVNIFGFNRAVGTVFETLWNNDSNYSYPASASALDAVSTSASDTMALLISGLDADYNVLSEVVTLSGTTPVTTNGVYLRINSAVILAGSNVGAITISNGVDYAYIDPGIGLTQQCVYTVPAGHTLYLFRIDLTSGTVTGNKYLTYRNVLRTHTGRTLRVAEATWQTGQQSFDRQIPFAIAEKTDFEFEVKSSSGQNEVSIFVEGVLVRNA
jgi:hypothetical protein